MTQSKRHKHANLIHAWAEGAEVQQYYNNEWHDINIPAWYEEEMYRIKPQVKKYRVAIYKHGLSIAENDEIASQYETEKYFVKWLTDWIEYDEPTAEQWPSELVERIAKIDRNASVWLRNNLHNLDNNSESLYSLMRWDFTPQGREYWSSISQQLGE